MHVIKAGDYKFWESLWREAREKSPLIQRRIRSENEDVENWSRRARWFARQTGGERGEQRNKAVFDFLKGGDVLRPGAKVLDIGSGPGNFAIPMARMGAEVTALEPAAEMLRIMEDRLKAEQLDNVTVVQRTWQEVLGKEEWLKGGFDLVFASMTPGVQDPENLQKMISASKKYCYYSSFSGQRWGQAHRDLWQRFFNEDMGCNASDIIYPFGFLYALGYRPKLSFVTIRREEAEQVEEAVESLCTFFLSFLDITPGARRVIEDYVTERSKNDIFKQENKFCHGMMLWRVDETFI
ncbi:MAG: class I SAM-dependent methyltransferase [Bacillota bacterium]|jgi:SAM-dependent methyltransferase